MLRSRFDRVSQWRVVQIEIHPLCLDNVSAGQGWFTDKHFQEILLLVKEFVQERVSLSSKAAPASRAVILTGPSLRLAFAFRKRSETHTCLTLATGEKTGFGNGGEYCWHWVHGEKLVVYAQPLGRGKDAAVQKLLTAMPDGHQPKVDISSYFVRSPRKSLTQVGAESLPEKRSEAIGTERRNEAIGTERRNEAIDTERRNEAIGTERRNEAIGTDRRNEAIGTERRNEAIGTDRRNETVGTERRNETVGTDRRNEAIGTDRRNETVGTERRNEAVGTENVTGRKNEAVESEIVTERGDEAVRTESVIERKNEAVGTKSALERGNEAAKEGGIMSHRSKKQSAVAGDAAPNRNTGDLNKLTTLAVCRGRIDEGLVRTKNTGQEERTVSENLPVITVSDELIKERLELPSIMVTPDDDCDAPKPPTARDCEDMSERAVSAKGESSHTDPCPVKAATPGEQDSRIKQTLKKFNSKLSKQYKKRGKLRAGRTGGAEGATSRTPGEMCVPERLDSLPDLTSPGVDSSETDPGFTSPGGDVGATVTSETDLSVVNDLWKGRLGGKKRSLRGLIGSDSDSTNSVPERSVQRKRGGKRSKQTLTVPSDREADSFSDRDSMATEVSPGGSHSPVFRSNSDNGNERPRKRPLRDSYSDGEALAKARKTTKFVKGKSYQQRPTLDPKTDSGDFSHLKDCSIHLERLSGEQLQHVDVFLAAPRSPVNSSSGLRVSRRMSQIFDKCEMSSKVIEIDSDAEGELDGILEDAASQMSQDVKTEEEGAMWSSIRSTRDVAELTSEQLSFLVLQNESWLRDIFQGKMYCTRHQDYKAGGKTRRDLMYQLYFGMLSDDQTEAVMDTLLSLFCRNHNKYLDYLMKVLLPEMFVKVYMEVFGLGYTEAETMIRHSKVPVPSPSP